jgi:hypothetical protein
MCDDVRHISMTQATKSTFGRVIAIRRLDLTSASRRSISITFVAVPSATAAMSGNRTTTKRRPLAQNSVTMCSLRRVAGKIKMMSGRPCEL